jgi:hypothetical protein
MAFKSRDLMTKLSAVGGQEEDGDTCTKCTTTHDDHGGDDGDDGNCDDCTMTRPPTGQEKRHALADPGLGLLRRQLRETLSGDAR